MIIRFLTIFEAIRNKTKINNEMNPVPTIFMRQDGDSIGWAWVVVVVVVVVAAVVVVPLPSVVFPVPDDAVELAG